MRFLTSFYVIVTAKLAFSSQCHEGYFSEEHKTCISCPEHCLFCDSITTCLSCQDGYWGNICELPCSSCLPGTICEKTNGFCLEKCKNGYAGVLCDVFCSDKCLNCDRMNASLCDFCARGRYGESCDKRCPDICYNNTCNDSGYCTYGCNSGYWGPECEKNCSSNCKHSSCDNQTGACIYGCKSNFVGSRCDREKQPANDDKSGEIWLVILIVVVVLIGIVSLVVCIVFRKKCSGQERQEIDKVAESEPLQSAERSSSNNKPFQETSFLSTEYKKEWCTPLITSGLNIFWKSCHVSDLSGRRTYILCEDTTNEVMKDASALWEMVWQEQCSVIVYLSGLTERKLKDKYWPEYAPQMYGIVEVKQIDHTYSNDFALRKFEIGRPYSLERREVAQMQFKAWPLNSFPRNEMCLINFRKTVNSVRSEQEGLLLVHCSDGLSRSSLYIALDILLEELKKKDHAPIEKYLGHLRAENLIQSDEQNDFLRKSVATWKELNSTPTIKTSRVSFPSLFKSH